MLRFHIIATTMVTIAAAAVMPAVAAEFPHDHPGQQTEHWSGTYTGYSDGRRAKLTIEHNSTTEMIHDFNVTLEDLDRNQTFTGSGQTKFVNPHGVGHIMQVIPLKEVGGSGQKDVNRLLLHTWDTDIISGSSQWNDTDYGLSFSQER
ncbi:hypothetical protein [Vreelandella massiliensis]|uniref:hypothetical protein n=1 Tax=Vreelandella massiliensis TaxID=1816686 RepID=UPI00096AAB33|nr:hypothetical protein [Halomonas massiliensis]